MAKDGEIHDGGCRCGNVRYRTERALEFSAHCHCRSCQLSVGAAFVTWAGLKKEQFSVTKGSIKTCETSPGVARGFCGNCGTSLTYENEEGWPGVISILAVTFDDPSFVNPTSHVYTSHQQPWIKLGDNLPTSDEH